MEKSQIENQKILENFPPVFKGVSQSILVYKNILIKVHAEDPENGTVTIDLNTTLNNNTYQFEQDQFNWTLDTIPRPTYVKFFAYDSSNAASLYWPEILHFDLNLSFLSFLFLFLFISISFSLSFSFSSHFPFFLPYSFISSSLCLFSTLFIY
ncbi:unnamed protein product [Acanthosepion pharaonis]|uniref:Uncharacterized protein n=1 Tax=Acanthosepion pharaonis TaxID=158019 RepID=A0A812B1A8_ACAPH|nr:unnamed protein product [Sepia pharaonis]